jgi:hypothetical protein
MVRFVASFLVTLVALLVAVSGSWISIASDSTGKNLVASSNYLYTSSDYGATWVPGTSSITWQGVASDASGKNLAAVATCTGSTSTCYSPFVSKDGGATWNGPSQTTVYKENYYAISSDYNGTTLAAAGGDNMYYSTSGGAGWRLFDLPSGFCGYVVSVSGDASTTLLSLSNKLTFTLDAGTTWKPVAGAPKAYWKGVSMDETGTVMAGAYDLSYETNGKDESAWYISTDGGKSSAPINAVVNGVKFYTVAVSGDGKYVFCGGSASAIYVYNVATKTITQAKSAMSINGSVHSISTTKTGQYVQASNGAGLWVSSDYGANFKQVI